METCTRCGYDYDSIREDRCARCARGERCAMCCSETHGAGQHVENGADARTERLIGALEALNNRDDMPFDVALAEALAEAELEDD
jgi:hypothetical protein